MSHTFTRIWIHAIWATKHRKPLIRSQVEKEIHDILANEFRGMNCYVKNINGMPDHVHCLFMLCPNHSLSSIIKQVKGSCSHYVNQNDLIPDKFAWQTGYSAYSVSESVVEKVSSYLDNQKKHHRKKTFLEEIEALKRAAGGNGINGANG